MFPQRGTHAKYKALGSSATVHKSHGIKRRLTTLPASQQETHRAEGATQRCIEIQSKFYPLCQSSSFTHVLDFTYEERDVVEQMDIDSGFSMDPTANQEYPPPGEEAFDLSHEGGEHEAFEGLANEIAQAMG